MSEVATQILESFDTLPPDEQHKVVTEMLRRLGELQENSVTDEQLLGLADEAFLALDREERDEPDTWTQ